MPDPFGPDVILIIDEDPRNLRAHSEDGLLLLIIDEPLLSGSPQGIAAAIKVMRELFATNEAHEAPIVIEMTDGSGDASPSPFPPGYLEQFDIGIGSHHMPFRAPFMDPFLFEPSYSMRPELDMLAKRLGVLLEEMGGAVTLDLSQGPAPFFGSYDDTFVFRPTAPPPISRIADRGFGFEFVPEPPSYRTFNDTRHFEQSAAERFASLREALAFLDFPEESIHTHASPLTEHYAPYDPMPDLWPEHAIAGAFPPGTHEVKFSLDELLRTSVGTVVSVKQGRLKEQELVPGTFVRINANHGCPDTNGMQGTISSLFRGGAIVTTFSGLPHFVSADQIDHTRATAVAALGDERIELRIPRGMTLTIGDGVMVRWNAIVSKTARTPLGAYGTVLALYDTEERLAVVRSKSMTHVVSYKPVGRVSVGDRVQLDPSSSVIQRNIGPRSARKRNRGRNRRRTKRSTS